MGRTRREFIRDMAVTGAAISSSGAIAGGAAAVTASSKTETAPDRCPYFDQPMYCKGLSSDGRPMCEK
jgi:hypothetical protein